MIKRHPNRKYPAAFLGLIFAAAAAVAVTCLAPGCLPPNPPQWEANENDFYYIRRVQRPYAAPKKQWTPILRCTAPTIPAVADILALLAARYYGDFTRYQGADLDDIIEAVSDGAAPAEMAGENAYYDYYREAYDAVLGGLWRVPHRNTHGGRRCAMGKHATDSKPSPP